MADTHRLLIVTTGGTIAGQVATNKQDEQMIRTADQFSELIGPTVSYLSKKENIQLHVETHDLCDLDSSNILPEHWESIAGLIKDKYDEFDSFVIAHGTNTLGYTCAALSFAIANSNKPIILTGSQVSAGLPGSDALTNLQNALRVAIMKRERSPIKGV